MKAQRCERAGTAPILRMAPALVSLRAFSTPECAFRKKEDEDVFLGVRLCRSQRESLEACAAIYSRKRECRWVHEIWGERKRKCREM